MNRLELLDRILDVKKELLWLEEIAPNRKRCDCFRDGTCTKHGPVPAEFQEVGCDEWTFDDVPFNQVEA